MTRLLCVTSWFPPHHSGGYELSCRDVMTRLADRGHHVEVLTSDHRHPGVQDGTPAPLAAIHRDLRLYLRDGDPWRPPVPTRMRVERHNQRVLQAALDSCRPDVVAVWHLGALSLGLLTATIDAGLPMVLAVCDDWPAYASKLDPWASATERHPTTTRILGAVARIPVGLPDLDTTTTTAFVSESTRRRCRRFSPWDFPHSTVVHSGIDLDVFAPDPEPATNGNDPLRLLYLGRIDERKGIQTLLRALHHLPGAELVVASEPDDRGRALLEEWADRADVSGRVVVRSADRAGLADLYHASDICVFPSEWEEPFGLVPLEAMACGTPVVATGTGGSDRFLVDGGNCVLFEPGDPLALASAVRRIDDDHGFRDHLVRAGITTATHFGVDRLTDAFEELYRSAADGSTDVPPPRPVPEVDVWAGAAR